MEYTVKILDVDAQPIAVVSGRATRTTLPARIRAVFDQFYSGFKSKGELNIVYYPASGSRDDFEIRCGVLLESGGNDATPAGKVATTIYMGPYDRMGPAHEAIHRFAREHGYKLAGASWEVYGHWNEDPSKLRTDIFYLLSQ